MKSERQGRGQPLAALSLILVAWVGARTLLWEGPASALRPSTVAQAATPHAPERRASPFQFSQISARLRAREANHAVPILYAERRASTKIVALRPSSPTRLTGAPNLSASSALSDVPLPDAPAPVLASLPSGVAQGDQASRWSADGWLLLRPGGSVGLGAPPTATYGASQAGAVLRYRFDTSSLHRPTAYARVTAALNGSRQKEAALGLSVRPFAGVPVIAAAELRVTDDRFGSRERPAAMLITELPPFRLPGGFTGEAYAQAGYVGGRASTGFVDGMWRADRRISRVEGIEVRAGAGVWGGAQKGAARVDVGPSATLSVPVSDSASARLALDWRFRIGGRAVPSSGPAFTLSAGF